MLITREAWELKNTQFGVLYAAEDRRFYPFCEVKGAIDLFHVEIQKKGRKRLWSRFIVTDVLDLIPLIRSARENAVRISLQTRAAELADGYDIASVVEIVEGTDATKQRAIMYKCSNGRRYMRSLSGASESEFTSSRVIYRREETM